MEKNKNIITIVIVLVVLIVIALLGWWYLRSRNATLMPEGVSPTENVQQEIPGDFVQPPLPEVSPPAETEGNQNQQPAEQLNQPTVPQPQTE